MTDDNLIVDDIEHRPQHPVYGDALSGATQTVDGVAFYPYRRRVVLFSSYIRVSHDGRIGIYDSGRSGTVYTCIVDGRCLPRTFRKFDAAARAGIAALDPLPATIEGDVVP